jgi:hypothetical protein
MNKSKTQRRVIEKPLLDASAEKAFWCVDGQIFRNIKELSEGLGRMSDDAFAYHSNAEKHDFSNWLSDVLDEERLARQLAKPITRQEAAEVIQSGFRVLI